MQARGKNQGFVLKPALMQNRMMMFYCAVGLFI